MYGICMSTWLFSGPTEPLFITYSRMFFTGAGASGQLLLAASMLPDTVDSDRFGAMCATVLALASRMAQEVERGALRQVIIEGEHGPVLLTQVRDVGVLAIAASQEAPLGRLILTARNIANALRKEEMAAVVA